MTPNFRLRNLAVNKLLEFYQGDFIWEYYEAKILKDYDSDIIETKFNTYKDVLVMFEDEVNQTIFSGNKIIIKALFENLINWREYFLSQDDNEIKEEIQIWNKCRYENYLKKIDENSNKYFSNPEFAGKKHNEEYEVYVNYSFMAGTVFGDTKLTKKIYRNFYCVEETLRYIEVEILMVKYREVYNEARNKFVKILDKYIPSYQAGDYFNEKEENDTWVDKQIRRLKNNKITGAIILLGIVFFALYGFYEMIIKLVPLFNSD